jgi:TolA-binding protein
VIRIGAALLWVGAALAAQQDPPLPQPPAVEQAAPAAPAKSPFLPFDAAAFRAHFQAQGVPAAQLEALTARIGEVGAAAACDEFLRTWSGDYGAAAKLAEAGDPQAALSLAKLLAGDPDPYLRAHVRYHLGRVFLDGDDPERAIVVLREFLNQDLNRTPLDGEALFFLGQAMRDLPQPEQALRAFAAFLQFFPDAPERFRSAAEQHVGELQAQMDSPLHGLADEMKGVERRIKKTDTGEETQKRQDAIVSELQKIIEEIEEREKQMGGGPGGLNNPSNPATKSALPDAGATRIGALNKVPGVADRWGRAKDQDRAAVETDVQQNLPPHYRALLEEYYRRLGTGR